MKRAVMDKLMKWISGDEHKPILFSGARQTGKTWLIRELAKESGKSLVEINFETNPEYKTFFETTDVQEICQNLTILTGKTIVSENTLLFLDEICPEVIGTLRWFYEEMPEISVIAASSLMEFVKEDYTGSFPVGRVSYLYLYPMTFIEFLCAMGEERLVDCLEKAWDKAALLEIFHKKFLEYFHQYLIVGGMPKAAQTWIDTRDISKVQEAQTDILATIRNDFHRYKNRMPADILEKTMVSAAKQMGNKFVLNTVDPDIRSPRIKQAVKLLEKAGILSRVVCSEANSFYLPSDKDERFFKTIFLDTGLALKLLNEQNIPAGQVSAIGTILWRDNHAAAKQFTAQMILSNNITYKRDLFYWQRAGSSKSEIDYLIQSGFTILPIVVKPGAPGSMKALHRFVESRDLPAALHLDLNPPSCQVIQVQTTEQKPVKYKLYSYPIYMAHLISIRSLPDSLR